MCRVLAIASTEAKGTETRASLFPLYPLFLWEQWGDRRTCRRRTEGWPAVVLMGRFACTGYQGSPDTGGASLNGSMPALSFCIDHQQFSKVDGDTWVLSVRPQCWSLQFWKSHLREEESTPSPTWFGKELGRTDWGGGAVGASGLACGLVQWGAENT